MALDSGESADRDENRPCVSACATRFLAEFNGWQIKPCDMDRVTRNSGGRAP
jgi:hypothetical protein